MDPSQYLYRETAHHAYDIYFELRESVKNRLVPLSIIHTVLSYELEVSLHWVGQFLLWTIVQSFYGCVSICNQPHTLIWTFRNVAYIKALRHRPIPGVWWGPYRSFTVALRLTHASMWCNWPPSKNSEVTEIVKVTWVSAMKWSYDTEGDKLRQMCTKNLTHAHLIFPYWPQKQRILQHQNMKMNVTCPTCICSFSFVCPFRFPMVYAHLVVFILNFWNKHLTRIRPRHGL